MFSTSRTLRDEVQTGHTAISTIKHIPMRIEVFPHRRGIRVRLSLLTDGETRWVCERVVQDLPTLCAQVGINEDDNIWQSHEKNAWTSCAENKEKASWTPFLMF